MKTQCTTFRELIMKEIDVMYRMALGLTRHEDSASDLMQETYLKALLHEDRYRQMNNSIRPWLFTIMRNVYYSKCRSNRRRLSMDPVVMDEAMPHDHPDDSRHANSAEINWDGMEDGLKHAVEELPENHRTVLLLWAIDGRKYREIARILNIPIGTVMSRLSRTRDQLKMNLAKTDVYGYSMRQEVENN